jgi:hypothetical protein
MQRGPICSVVGERGVAVVDVKDDFMTNITEHQILGDGNTSVGSYQLY